MKRKFILTAAIIAFCSCTSNSQNTKSKAIIPSVKLLAKEIYQQIPEKRYPGLKPGEIAPDAAKIDVDRIVTILNGVCIVQKGAAYALVDLKGNFIVPWGRYTEMTVPQVPFTTLIHVKDEAGLQGFINVKGEVVIPVAYSGIRDFNAYRILKGAYTRTRLDSRGNYIPGFDDGADVDFWGLREPLGQPQAVNRMLTLKGQYINKAGKITIQLPKGGGQPFSDGMAAVSGDNGYGEGKWGFIDTTGKLVIPYTYTYPPSNFHNGLAMVRPWQKADFDYAYIDKTGAVKFKVGTGADNSYFRYEPANKGNFLNGYAFWNVPDKGFMMMDVNGNFYKIADIIENPKLAKDETGFFYERNDERGILVRNTKYNMSFNNIYGIMGYDGQMRFPFAFKTIEPDYYSPYALAWRSEDKRVNNNPAIAGIVNRQGVFVMVVQNKSGVF